MVKHDRAYSDWQARESRKAEREAHQMDRLMTMDSNLAMAMWNPDEPRRAATINQVSRRAGKSEPLKGASLDMMILDEFEKIKGPAEPKPVSNERPPTKVTDYDKLFRRIEGKMAGRTLSGSEKRKVIAAENKRLREAAAQWDIDHEEELLRELEIEVVRSALGFGGW